MPTHVPCLQVVSAVQLTSRHATSSDTRSTFDFPFVNGKRARRWMRAFPPCCPSIVSKSGAPSGSFASNVSVPGSRSSPGSAQA